MNFLNETNWFAVQCRLYQEDLATACVAKLDVEVFLPRIRRGQTVCGFARQVTRPLFPGYFFARFCPSLALDAVRYAPAVLRVVGSSRFPIPVEEDIVSVIQGRVEGDGYIRLAPPP